MQATQDLWTATVPADLARDAGRFRAYLDALAWLSDVEPGSPLAARLAVVHLNPSATAAAALAEAMAARDGARGGPVQASHVGLGWLVVAAALGHGPAAKLLTVAHLRLLRGRRAVRGGPDDPGLLGTIERCAHETAAARSVRGFARAAGEGAASDDALDALIAELDPDDRLERFLAGDPDPTAGPSDGGSPSYPGTTAGGAPSRTDLARRMLHHRLPWLQTAIDALCPPAHGPESPTPPRPVLLAGPRNLGQDDLVRATAEITDMAHVYRPAADLTRPGMDVRAAVTLTEGVGARRLILALDGVDRLDPAAASALAGALRTEGLLPDDDRTVQRGEPAGLVMVAEHVERVSEDLRRFASVARVERPGPTHAAHFVELLGTAVAIERDLGAASELRISDRTWAALRDRTADGADMGDIKGHIEHACG